MQVQLSTEFALHGLLYLLAQHKRQPVQLAEIAQALQVKASYLRKIFQQMVKAGLLEAYKGASGGYSLKANPDQISFLDVMQAVEGQPGSFRCYARQRACHMHSDCGIIHGFHDAFNLFSEHLRRQTLGSILTSKRTVTEKMAWIRQP